MEKLTFVLTSCGRPDLLKATIDSFLQYNTYPVEEYIIVEDSADPTMKNWLDKNYGDTFKILFNDKKLGQIKSIDRVYAEVKTPLIFHCEDDWLFIREGFIEESLSIMNMEAKVICVNLRHLWATNGAQLEKRVKKAYNGVLYRYVEKEAEWNGFSFNPSVIRHSDYLKVAPYAALGYEPDVNKAYKALGYYGAILEEGAVEHIGDGQHLPIYEVSFFEKIKKGILLITPPILIISLKKIKNLISQ